MISRRLGLLVRIALTAIYPPREEAQPTIGLSIPRVGAPVPEEVPQGIAERPHGHEPEVPGDPLRGVVVLARGNQEDPRTRDPRRGHLLLDPADRGDGAVGPDHP